MIISLTDAIKRYGPIVDGHWSDETHWMTVVQIPAEIAAHWLNSATGKPTEKIYCNRDMSNALLRALNNVLSRGLLSELKTFDGCYMIRTVRGCKTSLSAHSYGLAIDVNAKENGLGCTPKLSPQFVKCFTDEGFKWGGTFHRQDGMHFSRCWE